METHLIRDDFTFGEDKQFFKQKLNDIRLEAILYDACNGLNYSIVELFDYYVECETNGKETPRPIKNFVLSKLSKLLTLEIEPSELLNPLGGKPPMKRLYPNLGSRSSLSILKQYKSNQTKFLKGINKFYFIGKTIDKKDKNTSPKMINNDEKILESRIKRLNDVESILNKMHYNSQGDGQNKLDLINQLNEIYQNPKDLDKPK